MKTYDLYAQSGPQMKKTVVFVPALLGCRARGDTSPEAIDAAPAAIRDFLAFLARSGERADPAAEFRTKVVEHYTEPGAFLGSIFLPTDTVPLSRAEGRRLLNRLYAMHGELRRIAQPLSVKQLDARPKSGRPIRQILQHLMAEAGYLRGVTGTAAVQRQVEQGRMDPLDGLDRLLDLERPRLDAMSDDERRNVVMRGQSPWTARSAVRNMLEHAWEHYVEIAGRLGKQA